MIPLDLLLRRIPAFASVPDEDLKIIMDLVQVADHEDGHVFTREGDVGQEVFLLVAGEVVRRRGGSEIDRLRPGALFGLMSLVDDRPRSATYRADGDCRVASLSRKDAGELFHRTAPVALAFQRAVAKQLATDFRRLNALIRERVGDTGAALLKQR